MASGALKYFAVASISLALFACGGSGSKKNSDTVNSDSYIQFYNASPNSAKTNVVNGTNTLGSARFGKVTRAYKVKDGEIKLKLTDDTSTNKNKEVKANTFKLERSEKALAILTGDYQNPDLQIHKFKRKKYSKQFALTATLSMKGSKTFDVYFAKSGTAFDKASNIGNIKYQSFTEAKSSEKNGYWAHGDYVFYLTEPGKKQIVFQSPAIKLATSTELLAVVRQVSQSDQNLVLDLISNSSSTGSYAHINAPAKYRVYNSLDNQTLDVSLSRDADSNPQQLQVSANSLSASKEINFGDYQLSVKTGEQQSLQNVLLTLPQGSHKSIVLYNDAEGKMSSLEVSESKAPQVKEHDINLVNLANEYDKIDIYFVRDNETVATAKYKAVNIARHKHKSLKLPNGHYEIVAIHKQSNDKTLLLFRTQKLALTAAKTYLVTLETEPQSASGYQLRIN